MSIFLFKYNRISEYGSPYSLFYFYSASVLPSVFWNQPILCCFVCLTEFKILYKYFKCDFFDYYCINIKEFSIFSFNLTIFFVFNIIFFKSSDAPDGIWTQDRDSKGRNAWPDYTAFLLLLLHHLRDYTYWI
jgi:hypothetical protein